ncbi:MAG TPA: hypothetical protein PLP49_10930 [Anaerohalosphaeraceae bacterium]|nr:hypothetical protein [Anaerohalosphaeraceae bacterium]HRT24513.1 hypothetical protein [Anaerohalosphaeraceae bacterium]
MFKERFNRGEHLNHQQLNQLAAQQPITVASIHTGYGVYQRRQPQKEAAATGGEISYCYAVITQVPEYNTSKNYYLVQRITLVEEEWIPDGEDLEIDRALGYEGCDTAARDIRNWIPWYAEDSIVKIVQRWDEIDGELKWFLDMPLIYAGAETTASLRHSPITGHVEAVWV